MADHKRITPADPIRELEHVRRIDTKFRHCLGVGGKRDKMLGDMLRIHRLLQQPVTRRTRIHQGFLRGKGLGSDDEQRGLRIKRFQLGIQIRTVHVGHEMHTQRRAGKRLQCVAHHQRAEIGTADADIHHIGDRLAGIAAPCSIAHAVGKQTHLLQRITDAGQHIQPVHPQRRMRRIGRGAQRGMQHRTAFRKIDLFTAEHLVAPILHSGLARQREQQGHGLLRNQVLGIVEQQIVQAQGEALKTFGIGSEGLSQRKLPQRLTVILQGLPCRRLG